MRRLALLFIVCFVITSCASQLSTDMTVTKEPAVAELSESAKLNVWFDKKYEAQLMSSPLALTFQGRKERYAEIDDMSEAAQLEQLRRKGESVKEMKAMFSFSELTDEAKLSYDLWEHQYESMLADKPFMRSGYVFHQMNGTHSFFPTLMMNYHRVTTEQDMQDYVSRLSAIGEAMNELTGQAKLAAEEGVRPPRFAYETVMKESQSIISGIPFDGSDKDSTLWADAKTKTATLVEAGTITQQQGDAILDAARAALVNHFAPGYQNLITFMNNDISNTSETAMGVHALPDGAAYYEYRLKSITTTNMTAEDIHQLGLSEVTRIRVKWKPLKRETASQAHYKTTLR
jgi:uncharacterized protein (DUF885 family)